MAGIFDQATLPSFTDYLPQPDAPQSSVPEATGQGNFLSAGLGSGIYGAGATLGSAAEALGRVVGADSFADSAKGFADRQRATAQTYARQDLEDAPWYNPTAVAYRITQGLPMLAAGLGGAAIAGPEAAVGAAGAEAAGGLSGLLGSLFTRQAVGGAAGALPFVVGQNVQRNEDYTGAPITQGKAAEALALGLPEAALQGILPARLEGWLAKGVGKTAATDALDSIAGGATDASETLLSKARRGIVNGALVQMPVAAATEFLTQAMGDPNRGLASRLQGVVDAAIGGGVQGAVFGGAFGALAKARPDTVKTDDLLGAVDQATGNAPPPNPTGDPDLPAEHPNSAWYVPPVDWTKAQQGPQQPITDDTFAPRGEAAPPDPTGQPGFWDAPAPPGVIPDAHAWEVPKGLEQPAPIDDADKFRVAVQDAAPAEFRQLQPPQRFEPSPVSNEPVDRAHEPTTAIVQNGFDAKGNPILEPAPIPLPGSKSVSGEIIDDTPKQLEYQPSTGSKEALPADDLSGEPGTNYKFVWNDVKRMIQRNLKGIPRELDGQEFTSADELQSGVAKAINDADRAVGEDPKAKPASKRLVQLGKLLDVVDDDGQLTPKFQRIVEAGDPATEPTQLPDSTAPDRDAIPEKHQGRYDRLQAARDALGQNIPDDPDAMQLASRIEALQSRLQKPQPGETSKIEQQTRQIEAAVNGKIAQARMEPMRSAVPPDEPLNPANNNKPSPKAQAYAASLNPTVAPQDKVATPQRPVPPVILDKVGTALKALQGLQEVVTRNPNDQPKFNSALKAQAGKLKQIYDLAKAGDGNALAQIKDNHFGTDFYDQFEDRVKGKGLDKINAHANAEQDVIEALRNAYQPDVPMVAKSNPASQHDVDIAHVIDNSSHINDALGYLRQNGTSGLVKEMANRLSQFASGTIKFASPEGLKFDTSRVLDPDTAVKGSYNPQLDRTNIYSSDNLEHTVLHEAAHSATLKAFDRGGPAAEEMKGLYDRVKARSPDNDAYGLTNTKEMVAEGFSNPSFQEFLKGEPVSTGSKLGDMWQAFKNAAFKLLGMPERQRSLFDQVMEGSQRLMQEGRAAEGRTPVETPLIKANNGLKNQGRANQAIYSRVKDAMDAEVRNFKINLSPKLRAVGLGWMTGDHIAEVYGKLVGSLKTYTALANERVARRDVMNKHAGAAMNIVNRIDAANGGKVKPLIEKLAARSAQEIDPRFDWAHNSWLHDSPNAAVLQQEHAEAVKDWNNLKRLQGGADAYDAMRASNSANHFARLAHFLYDFGVRNPMEVPKDPEAAKNMPNYGSDPFREYAANAKLHDDPQKAEGFWRQKVSQLQAAVLRQHDLMTGQMTSMDPKSLEGRKLAASITEMKQVARDTKVMVDQASRAPYFHLGREGDYFVAGHLPTNTDGTVNDAALTKLRDALQAKGFKDVAIMRGLSNPTVYMRVADAAQMDQLHNVMKEQQQLGNLDQAQPVSANLGTHGDMLRTVAPSWMMRAVSMLENTKPEYPMGATADQITAIDNAHDLQVKELRRQVLSMVPDNYAKIYQTRQGVQGFSKDFIHGFQRSSAMAASGLSSLSMNRDIGAAQAGMHSDLRALNDSNASTQQRIAAAQAVNEMVLREKGRQIIVPKSLMDGFRALTHTIQVGASPIYSSVLMSQVPTLSLAELAKTFGYARSALGLAKAGKTTFAALGAVARAEGNDKFTFGMRQEHLEKAGLPKKDIDFLMAINARGGFNATSFTEAMTGHDTSTTWGRTQAMANMLGRYSEMAPRFLTAIAARDLFEARGMKGDVVDFAMDKVTKSQFNWNPELNARQTTKAGSFGSYSPLINQFMGYQIRMSEKLIREVHDAFAGESPQAKKEARTFLVGHLTAVMALSGVLGVPVAATAAGVIDRLSDWFTGKDDYDMVASFRSFLANTFGKDVGEVIARGLPRAFGADFDHASEARILPGSTAVNMLFEKRKMEDAQRDFLKAETGSAFGFVMKLALAGRDMTNGDWLDAAQRVVPEAVEGPFSAYKLATRGFVDKTGAKLPITANAEDILLTALSAFGDPAKEEEYAEVRKTATGLDQMRTLRAQNIERHLQLAVNRRDPQMLQDWTNQSTQFVMDHPGMPSPEADLAASLQAHAQQAGVARGLGMPVGVNLRDLSTVRKTQYGNFRN